MSELVGPASSVLLSVSAAPTPLADPGLYLRWLHVWLPAAGLLAMGLGNFFGGGGDDEEEAGGGVEGDDDFLSGEFDGSMDGEGGGFEDGLDDDDDDPLAEIEPRISDLEADIEDLSSTVSSISGEHESMRESVDDIEDNVRKLLEVYEVVTQGANPFADAPDTPAASGGGFGLLDADGGGEMDAGDDEESLFGDVDEDDGPADNPLAEAAEEPSVDDETSEGKSFDDLKSEFDFVGDEGLEEGVVPEDANLDELDLDLDDDGAEFEDADPESPEKGGRRTKERDSHPEKPYLTALPDGYGAELLVMEWLDFLVGESSMGEAMRAIRYYRTVDWISEDVASHLQSVLSGTTPTRELATPDGGLPTELSVDHHSRSLEFVSRLSALEGSGHPIGSPDGTLDGLRFGRRDHGVQR